MSDFPTCPSCGHEFVDGWEDFLPDKECADIECPECEHEYFCARHVHVSYWSKPIDPPADPQDARDAAAEQAWKDARERFAEGEGVNR